MPTAWDDILTLSEVQDDSISSSSAVADNPNNVVEGAIRDAQDRIADHIGRDPIVHRTKDGLRYDDWEVDDTKDPAKYRAWADDWPLVEIQSPSEVSIRRDNRQFLRDTRKVTEVDYHAGWKRRDQSLSDIDGTNSGTLTALTTAPNDLPRDIRRTALKLTLFYLTEAGHQVGIGRVEQVVGSGGTMTVEGVDTGFVERQLRRLNKYKDWY